ncbi:glutathione S-transferase 1-like [Musca autumnalis]|uniref:glutathione S-transferase 1-like n=1 Tax=Musca autumnalis TaxID=221902 RepID=UPI003CF932F5
MTAKPILYYTPGSPPCSSVMLCAGALGLELDLKAINLKDGDHLTPEFLKMNPTHTIPVLNDNGVVVTDSHVICSYLADKYAVDESLYPKDKVQRMQVDARLYFDCGHLFPRVRIMVEPVIYFGEASISEEKIRYMQRAYDGLEKALASGKYLCGDHLTIADLCCVASVASAEKFAPIEEDKYPNVKAWLQRLSELPYYKKYNAEQADILYNLVQTKFEENKKA